MEFAIRSLLVLSSVAGMALAGCGQGRPTTGGDSPVTRSRLAWAELTDIRRDVSWQFAERVTVTAGDGSPLPADLATSLGGSQEHAPREITAAWKLDEAAGKLLLSEMMFDGNEVSGNAALPVRPAGHVRVNLGDRQYNMFPGRIKPAQR